MSGKPGKSMTYVVTLHGSGETLGRIRLSRDREFTLAQNEQGPSKVCEAGKVLPLWKLQEWGIEHDDYVRFELFWR